MGAKHEPVQPYLIRPKVEQLLEDYRNNTDHIISWLARFHIEFEGIHLVLDGCPFLYKSVEGKGYSSVSA